MGATAPPPLPDCPPPLPRPALPYAPQPPGWGPAHAQRTVGPFTRFCMYTPLPVTLACAALFLAKQSASGADFRHDTAHSLIKVFDAVVFGSAAGVTVLTAGIMFLCTRRRLEPPARRKVGAGLAFALAAGVLCGAASERVFQSAKTRAYASVNPAKLAADCAAVAAAPRTYVSSSGEYAYNVNDPVVPAYTRSIGANWVRMTPAGVRVIMSAEPISGVNDEGFFVPLAPLPTGPQAFAAQNRMTVLSTHPPVFRYASRR